MDAEAEKLQKTNARIFVKALQCGDLALVQVMGQSGEFAIKDALLAADAHTPDVTAFVLTVAGVCASMLGVDEAVAGGGGGSAGGCSTARAPGR